MGRNLKRRRLRRLGVDRDARGRAEKLPGDRADHPTRLLPGSAATATTSTYVVIDGLLSNDFLYNDSLTAGAAPKRWSSRLDQLEAAWARADIPRHAVAFSIGDGTEECGADATTLGAAATRLLATAASLGPRGTAARRSARLPDRRARTPCRAPLARTWQHRPDRLAPPATRCSARRAVGGALLDCTADRQHDDRQPASRRPPHRLAPAVPDDLDDPPPAAEGAAAASAPRAGGRRRRRAEALPHSCSLQAACARLRPRPQTASSAASHPATVTPLTVAPRMPGARCQPATRAHLVCADALSRVLKCSARRR